MFAPEASKALFQFIHAKLLHNTMSAGRASSNGDRSVWLTQAAVSRISQGAKDWEECQIGISFWKWSCWWWGCNHAMDGQFACYHDVYNPPSKWWGFTGTENAKASRQQEYQCKWSKFHISSWRMPERAWYTCNCWCLQPAQGGSGCSWPVSNLLRYTAHIQTQLVSILLLDSGDSPYRQPYNLSRSASKQSAHYGSLWLPSLHCVWPSASWKSINNGKFHTHSGFTANHSVGSPHTICPAPTAYQASYQAHPPAPLPIGTRNAFPTLDGE